MEFGRNSLDHCPAGQPDNSSGDGMATNEDKRKRAWTPLKESPPAQIGEQLKTIASNGDGQAEPQHGHACMREDENQACCE